MNPTLIFTVIKAFHLSLTHNDAPPHRGRLQTGSVIYTHISSRPNPGTRIDRLGVGDRKTKKGQKNETEKQNHFRTVLLASGSISPYSSRVTSWSKFSVPPLPLLTFTTVILISNNRKGVTGVQQNKENTTFSTLQRTKKGPSVHLS